MKKVIAISVAVASCAVNASAARADYTELKQGGAFTTGGVVGAVLGGPIGMFVGALGGAYVAEQIKKVDEQEDLVMALAQSEQKANILSLELAARNRDLAQQEENLSQLQDLALDKLQLQVMFHTGSDVLTEQGAQQLESLASFLQRNGHLAIQLNGHTDPRGTDEYNNVLSQYRAKSVEQALVEKGVAAKRIAVSAFGSGQSRARSGDLEAYALERRVDIEILQPETEAMAMGH